MATGLAWGLKVSPEFRAAVLAMPSEMGWQDGAADYVMACMAFETGGSFDPAIRNRAGSSGTGLIQFMHSTAIWIGTSLDALAGMTAVAQLEWVAAYFERFPALLDRDITLSDLYMAILMPRYIGEPDSVVIFSTPAEIQENAGLEVGGNPRITKGEATAHVQAMLDRGMQPGYFWQEGASQAGPSVV